MNRFALIGFVWAAWFFFAIIATIVLSAVRVSDPGWSLTNVSAPQISTLKTWWGMTLFIVFCVPGFIAPLVTTVSGFTAVEQIKLSPRSQHGMGLAVFDKLFFPLLLGNGLILAACLSALMLGTYMATDSTSQRGVSFIVLAAAVLIPGIPLILLNHRFIRSVRLAHRR